MVLPESSHVIINADSRVTFKKNFTENRQVNLAGEAFFEVEPGSTFTVVTDQGIVTVIGTSFNVKARPGIFEVSCYTGKVRVEKNELQELITPGEKVEAINNKLVKEESVRGDIPSWTVGKFNFENVSFEEVADELERQYKVNLIYSEKISQRLYTGLFEKGDLDKALDLVTWPLHLTYKIQGSKVIISE